MNDIVEFLTSKEIIVVYIVFAIACFLCFIIYLIDRNYYKRKRKQNTKELNKLVEAIEAEIGEVPVETQEIIENKPVLSTIEKTKEIEKVEDPVIIESLVVPEREETVEDIILNNMPAEEEKELLYTDIEPNQTEAQQELLKLTKELEKAEAETKNIDLTAYEEEQEENAIISLDELLKKSKEMYAANEITQYEDEGNEPISIEDLELRMQEVKKASAIEEPVIIEEIIESESENIEPIRQQMVLDDFNSIKIEDKPTMAYQTTKKFQSSPVISPIYGIERKESSTDIELENTANYEKLDEEIKKTNEFLMTLRELQKNLDL